VSHPNYISFKCERCGHSSEVYDDFKKGGEGLDYYFGCISIPVVLFAFYLMFFTDRFWTGVLCMLGLIVFKVLTSPKICCPRCDGRKVKEVYHY
jgi:hypothetical protein